MAVLVAENVSKKYGSNTALAEFSLELHEGEIIALLGPNGAGKTTFVKSVLGLLNVDLGNITLFGGDVKTASSRKNLAYLPEKFTFYEYFTVEGTLKFYAKMYGVESELDEKVASSLAKLSIEDLSEKKIKELSKGQLQRVGLACSIIGDQDFIILDEPFSGLDPIGIKEVKDLCLDLKKRGKTILVNSHILAEMERIADKVIILNKGHVKAHGTVAEVSNGISLEERFYALVKGEQVNA